MKIINSVVKVTQLWIIRSINRRYSKKIDLVEEREGKLFGYEMKWGAARTKPPREWLEAYPNATWQLINRQNYLEMIT